MTPVHPPGLEARLTGTRVEVVTQLLERYNEFVDPMQSGNGDGDTGLRLMPATYTSSVRELERILRVMREDRAASLVRLKTGEKASVRSLWWHVNQRYIACSSSLKDVRVRRKAKNGKHVVVIERRLVPAYPPEVSLVRVERGVEWIADAWSVPFEPMLPRVVLVAA